MIDWKVCETELEESIKKVLTWSRLIDLPTGVRDLFFEVWQQPFKQNSHRLVATCIQRRKKKLHPHAHSQLTQ